ncbi:MAG: TIM44-like domain-containing protein [Chitinophagaceae bacterium]
MKRNQGYSDKATEAASLLLLTFTSACTEAFARGGGGGGHSSHSSSSDGYGGGGFSSGGSGGTRGLGFIIFIIIIVVVINLLKKGNTNRNNLVGTLGSTAVGGAIGDVVGALLGNDADTDEEAPRGSQDFPEGLTPQKVKTAFLEIQQAWQEQNLGKVRKWISDGVYQRFSAQFEMMQQLTQANYLSNIRIHDISVANVYSDGAYDCADIIVTFSMDDQFICQKYPSLNETYYGDTDSEYWTFVRRKDAKASNADLYSSDNCPNCGASLENKLGEVSRCKSCGTLVNNAAYDWILSEITQDQDYETRKTSLLADQHLRALVQNDPLFAAQRMEDIASNVFMQIMEILSGDSNRKLERFASKDLGQQIQDLKNKNGIFVFDRLYLNDVTLSSYSTDDGNLNLHFDLGASFKRVLVDGNNINWIDRDFVDARFSMVLSKKLRALQTPPREIAYSYECASCGAPFDDTTDDACTYCGAPVVDVEHNWVLTAFAMG